MEPRGIKRAGERLDSYPNKEPRHRKRTRWNVEDYRRDAGLMLDTPQIPQETLENSHTFKMARAVDQARSKLDHYGKQMRDARDLLGQLEIHMYTGNHSEKVRILNKLEEERDSNRYIDKILNAIDQKNYNRGFSLENRRAAVSSVKANFDSFLSNNSQLFSDAKKQFDDLAQAINNRNVKYFNQIERELELKKTVTYI